MEIGKYVRAPREEQGQAPDVGAEVEITSEPTEFSRYEGVENQENLLERFSRLEQIVLKMAEASQQSGKEEASKSSADQWARGNSELRSDVVNIRWEHLKPFPQDVPSSKLWETWSRYLETFEIGAEFSNANTPADKCRLLYLALGEEMQAIVRAAELRPPLDEADCYVKFIQRIDRYFKSMSDPAVEHETFLNMRQLEGESIVRFHTRLVEKVRLCEYSSGDQMRFVQLQLLKGMRNQELAKYARMYGHDTLQVVQAATRNEAYEAGLLPGPSSAPPAAMAMERTYKKFGRSSNSSAAFKKERKPTFSRDGFARKRFRPNTQELCKQCGRPVHKELAMCPATSRSCNVCKRRGHFAVMCPKTRINYIDEVHQASQEATSVEPSDQKTEV